MKEDSNSQPSEMPEAQFVPSKTRTIIFILQILFVLGLLVIWLSSPSIRQNKSLWVLFFYTFPSNFFISFVPYDPAILFFGKYHPALDVAVIGTIATLLTETINYSTFKYLWDATPIRKIGRKKFVTKIIDLFNKSPFLALVIAAFTPIPFYPFRFLVVIARYPLFKYLLATFIGRAPRLYLIAFFGDLFNIPDILFLAFFVGATLVLYLPFIRMIKRKRKKKGAPE
jgi:membrane protein YqaA with SNARE-associated domain